MDHVTGRPLDLGLLAFKCDDYGCPAIADQSWRAGQFVGY